MEVVVVVVLVGSATALAAVDVGTVSGGAPEVSAEVEPPPPQAASDAEAATPARSKASLLIGTTITPNFPGPSGIQRFHPPTALRAVVQILLC